jgi:N-acyl-D-amino-acid deacylase
MGLADRGVIRVGLWADLTIFDLERIKDASTWEKPTASPEGIDYVIVNGKVAIDNGRRTSVNPGRVLRHECEAQ